MSINTVKLTDNKANSSLINSLNIHDTPSSSKYKYLRALINMEIEDDNKNKKKVDNRHQDTRHQKTE